VQFFIMSTLADFSTYHRLWGGDTCHHPITIWNSSPTTGNQTEQPINILVDQEYNYTDSHSSESKRDKLESGERKLERVANVNTSCHPVIKRLNKHFEWGSTKLKGENKFVSKV
jgi:hypothetical protein